MDDGDPAKKLFKWDVQAYIRRGSSHDVSTMYIYQIANNLEQLGVENLRIRAEDRLAGKGISKGAQYHVGLYGW